MTKLITLLVLLIIIFGGLYIISKDEQILPNGAELPEGKTYHGDTPTPTLDIVATKAVENVQNTAKVQEATQTSEAKTETEIAKTEEASVKATDIQGTADAISNMRTATTGALNIKLTEKAFEYTATAIQIGIESTKTAEVKELEIYQKTKVVAEENDRIEKMQANMMMAFWAILLAGLLGMMALIITALVKLVSWIEPREPIVETSSELDRTNGNRRAVRREEEMIRQPRPMKPYKPAPYNHIVERMPPIENPAQKPHRPFITDQVMHKVKITTTADAKEEMHDLPLAG